jgi:hypothetical protein
MGHTRDSSYDAHFDLDTENTLPHEDVANSLVDKVARRLTRVDHEAIGELHGFCTGSTQLARHDHLAPLGARLHDKAKNTIARTERGGFRWVKRVGWWNSNETAETTYRRTARPPRSLYLKLSHCAMAHNPRF